MRYEVYLRRKAIKSIKRLPPDIKERVREVIMRLNDFPLGLDVRKIKGTKNKYRVRVGDYRIIIELQKNMITVIDVLPREKAY